MNTKHLVFSDSTDSGLWSCGKCGKLYRGNSAEEFAERCCRCSECGGEIGKGDYTTIHAACSIERSSRINAKRLESAQEMQDYDGWVYVDRLGRQHGFFPSVDELIEYCHENKIDIPEFAFCCEENQFFIDWERAIENAESQIGLDFCEDYEPEYDRESVKAFAVACAAFNEANKHIKTYDPDFKRKVRIYL